MASPCQTDDMKPHTEMVEGTEAFDRFKSALKAILTVPKSALPPSPFNKSGSPTATRKTKKPAVPKN
jgi:hypothetical protein